MRILVIDDDSLMARSLAKSLIKLGHTAAAAASGAEGLLQAKRVPPDLVLLDVNMPEIGGLELLPQLRALAPGLSVVMMTGMAHHQGAVQAIKLGAEDYLEKPFEVEELQLLLDRVAAKLELNQRLESARLARVADLLREYQLLSDPGMKKVYADVEQVAKREQVTVLIQGETGTGKEHVARLLHLCSGRSLGPFVELHCAAMPESLLESELFGYEPGAFTGAGARKPGLLETAQGGTLFLDEVGELPHSMQVKLLKVLEEKQSRRLGGIENLKLDIRVVAATNRDLLAEVKAGRFRSDLYYRLNVFAVQLPPLRERPGDIADLAAWFLARDGAAFGKAFEPLSPELVALLQAHPWPGNARELRNVMERLLITCPGGAISPQQLRAALPEARPSAPAPVEIDRQSLSAALVRSHGDKSKAAKALGVSRPTLYRYINKYELDL